MGGKEESPEQVAARLRQKIRSQAEELLFKVDKSIGKRRSAAGLTDISERSQGVGGDNEEDEDQQQQQQEKSQSQSQQEKQKDISKKFSHDENDDEDDDDDDDDDEESSEEEEDEDIDVMHEQRQRAKSLLEKYLESERIKDVQESGELTKRLQKLALERQKQNTGDRLKVIESDASLQHLRGAKTFQELSLPEHLLTAIFNMGFDRPSAIQEEALPRILAEPPRNLIGQAQSGSGKTAAFTLGMLFRIVVDDPATTQALCVTPTRELAIQIFEKAVKPMASNMAGLKVQLAIAGTQIAKSQKTVDAHMIIGTPGKVVDWLKRKLITTKNVKVFVLDEADNMVEEGGHRANSLRIKKSMPDTCQALFFSATFPPEVVDFAAKMVDNPDKILIEEGPEFLVLDIIKQLWIDTREYEGGKLMFLADIYSLLTIGQSIVFVGTKKDADMVHETLTLSGYTCSVLHGNVESGERDTTMLAFREGESNVLITTNVLARGVDVDNVCLVINYDVPVDKNGEPDFETYLHRIGRTGRFGRKGTAINLINDQKSLEVLAAIENHFSMEGKEMIAQAKPDAEALADMIEI